MLVGIPKGLLYLKYHRFIETLLKELDIQFITSPDTNVEILNLGTKCCIDEACLPIKIFHGHVAYLKDKCDLIIIPRIMQLAYREFICPKFCGLPEMVINNINGLPKVFTEPIYAYKKNSGFNWVKALGYELNKSSFELKMAYKIALNAHKNSRAKKREENNCDLKVALVGHPYNIQDKYVNMDLINKLNIMKISVITEQDLEIEPFKLEDEKLIKRPFWTFAKNSYSFVSQAIKNKNINGIIYVSSFGCGIDSVCIELIKSKAQGIPFLILKVDEHTGEAGYETRIEAFSDMLQRKAGMDGYNISSFW